MQIIKLGEQLNCPLVVCLGFFGCMHKGHIELLNRAKARAQITHSKVALFTFNNNHLAVLKRDATVVYTYEERLSIYDSLGVDYVITATFDDDFKNLTGEQFLTKFNQYNLQSLFCGFDHRCGSDRLDARGIQEFFKNIPVYIVEQVSVDGQKVSTTLLRSYLINNQIDKANVLLSEPFFAIGNVIHGRGVGKSLGFPTANIQISTEKLLPCGVYGGITYIGDKEYRVIVNIGKVPTFNIEQSTFEAHIIDYSGDIYCKKIKISLIKFLRPTTKFSSTHALIAQLKRDKENVLND